MEKVKRFKRPRVRSAIIQPCRGKVGSYWWPLPLDKKNRLIPSSVDCLYNQDYFSSEEVLVIIASL